MTAATVLGRRACAALGASSAVLHGLALIGAPVGVAAVLTAAMLVACLYCVRDLWRHGTLRAWLLVALMNLAMIAVHLPMPHGHHAHGVPSGLPTQPGTLMMAATALAVVEVIAASVVLFYRTRTLPPAVLGSVG